MLVIDSNPNNILKVENYLQTVKRDYGLLGDRYSDILISITEAVNNAIIHGNKADENKKVKISMGKASKGITFSVSDEGKGFDPNEIPDPTCLERIECCGGRGVYIMSKLADKLSFRNNGSTVEMFFKLS